MAESKKYLRVKTPRTFMPGDQILGRLNAPERATPLTVVQSPRIIRDMHSVGVKVAETPGQLVFCTVGMNYVIRSER